MEKPTGVIQKIIESLQQVNALDVYSPIEKDIILHNLRAAYMIFLNVKTDELSATNRVNVLAFEDVAETEMQDVESENFPSVLEEAIEEELLIETEPLVIEVPLVEETIEEELLIETEPLVTEVPLVEEIIEEELLIETEPLVTEVPLVEEIIEEELLIETEPLVTEAPLVEEIIEEELLIETEPLVTEAPLVEEEIMIIQPIEEKVIKTPDVLLDDILEFIPDASPQPGLLFEDLTVSKPEKKSLNDLLIEKKEDHSLSTRFQQSFIPDLTKAIAINEKFTFIRELFRNSGVDFSNAIQKLNECENIDTAFVLMEKLKHQYLWDTTSTSYLSLCDLVRRRFL